MIEKIQIRGFGANKKLDVGFGHGVTTIVGKSFVGKSWILRALRWITLNKPAGTKYIDKRGKTRISYINWSSDKARIRLSIDNKKVIRIRSKSLNTYKLNAKSYIAFKDDVPKDIAELLNLSELNFQGQHEAPFWFCKTAGEVSRQLNNIVNLQLIDSTLANIESEKRRNKTVIEITEKALAISIQQKKDLLYIEDLNSDLENVEKLQKQHEQDLREHATIEEKVRISINTRNLIESRSEQVSDGLKVLSIGKLYLRIADLSEKLSELVESGQNQQNILKSKPPSFQPLEKLKEKNERITKRVYLLGAIIEGIEDWRKQKCLMEETSKNLMKELEEIAGNRCPLCGAKMKKT